MVRVFTCQPSCVLVVNSLALKPAPRGGAEHSCPSFRGVLAVKRCWKFQNSESRGSRSGSPTTSTIASIITLCGVLSTFVCIKNNILSCGFLNCNECHHIEYFLLQIALFLNSKLYTWDLSMLKYVDVNNFFSSSIVFKYLHKSVYPFPHQLFPFFFFPVLMTMQCLRHLPLSVSPCLLWDSWKVDCWS